MARIFIFIDESGQVNPTYPFFSAAATWCVPEDHVTDRIALRPTWKALIGYLRDRLGHRINEIRYSHSARMHADVLIGMIEGLIASDPTIQKKHFLWEGLPINFTACRTNVESEARSLGLDSCESVKNPDFAQGVRARIVGGLMHPLLVYQGSQKLDVTMIFDGCIWKACIKKCFGEELELLIRNRLIEIELKYEDSMKYPGLQISDLAAGVIRGFSTCRENEKGYRIICNHSLHHISGFDK
jgi:hypothetical protein